MEALQKQTYQNFEALFVDDCSDDDTHQQLLRGIDLYGLNARVLCNDNNRGPAYSRNRAIDVAAGEWLAFCDADDWYEPNFLEVMYLLAREQRADIVMCEYRKVFESNKKSVEVDYLHNILKEPTKDELMIYSKSSLCLLFFRKLIIGEMKIPDLRNGEDIAFVPCIESRANKIAYVPQPLYNYYIRRESVSNSVSKTICDALCCSFEFIEHEFENRHPLLLEFLGVKTVLYGAIINAFKAHNDICTINKIIDDFVKKYPDCMQNRYISTLSVFKRVFLYCIKYRCWRLARTMAWGHSKLSI